MTMSSRPAGGSPATVDLGFIRRHTTEMAVRDGTRIRVRPIVPADRTLLVDGFRRLSPESRYRRFMAPIQELTDAELAYLTEVDYHDHFAWVALSLDDPATPGIGVARYVRLREEPEVAEAAVTVVDDYHGRGVGTALVQLLGATALEHGIRRFRGYAVEGNVPLRELVDGLGGSAVHDSPGVVRVETDLPQRAEELRGSPLYELLRAAARGQGPTFLPPTRLTGPGGPDGGSP